jgi:DNA polymerase-3 subunit alpha
MFINLGVHSYYSLLMSSMSVDDIIDNAIKNQQHYVTLVDFNNLYGAMEFYCKATRAKLIPIIGLHIMYQNQHVYVFAKNNQGYHNLIKLSSKVMTQQIFDINDYLTNTYIIVDDLTKTTWLKNKTNAYSYDNDIQPIALQVCYFASKTDVIYFKGLKAIGQDAKLNEFDNNRDFDQYYLLTDSEAKKKFSTQALKNLQELLETCK